MTIYKIGQIVELRSGKRAYVARADVLEPGPMADVESYWVMLDDSSRPLRVNGIDILRVLGNVTSQKIKAVAKKRPTTGTWYSWGPAKFNQQWVTACQTGKLLEHAIEIPKAIANLVGPGLYLACELWRSSVYAKVGANVLIVKLRDVPTIDVRQPQMEELQQEVPPPAVKKADLDTEKVNPPAIAGLARYLYIFSSNGHYACLTAHKGVTCSVDLGDLPAPNLLMQAKKVGMDAAQPLWDQARSSRLDPTTLSALKDILKPKGAKTD